MSNIMTYVFSTTQHLPYTTSKNGLNYEWVMAYSYKGAIVELANKTVWKDLKGKQHTLTYADLVGVFEPGTEWWNRI